AIRFPIDAPEVVARDVVPEVGKLHGRALTGRVARTGGGAAQRLPVENRELFDAMQEGAVEAESGIGHWTGTASITRSTIASDRSPSACPSKLSRTRWRRAGRASAWISATATLYRPSIKARTWAQVTSACNPRGLAPART